MSRHGKTGGRILIVSQQDCVQAYSGPKIKHAETLHWPLLSLACSDGCSKDVQVTWYSLWVQCESLFHIFFLLNFMSNL
jgi:hypothetical protein